MVGPGDLRRLFQTMILWSCDSVTTVWGSDLHQNPNFFIQLLFLAHLLDWLAEQPSTLSPEAVQTQGWILNLPEATPKYQPGYKHRSLVTDQWFSQKTAFLLLKILYFRRMAAAVFSPLPLQPSKLLRASVLNEVLNYALTDSFRVIKLSHVARCPIPKLRVF